MKIYIGGGHIGLSIIPLPSIATREETYKKIAAANKKPRDKSVVLKTDV